MQDPLETRLSQLPLRPAPAHWRRAILNRAADVPPRRRAAPPAGALRRRALRRRARRAAARVSELDNDDEKIAALTVEEAELAAHVRELAARLTQLRAEAGEELGGLSQVLLVIKPIYKLN